MRPAVSRKRSVRRHTRLSVLADRCPIRWSNSELGVAHAGRALSPQTTAPLSDRSDRAPWPWILDADASADASGGRRRGSGGACGVAYETTHLQRTGHRSAYWRHMDLLSEIVLQLRVWYRNARAASRSADGGWRHSPPTLLLPAWRRRAAGRCMMVINEDEDGNEERTEKQKGCNTRPPLPCTYGRSEDL